jgi:aminoglycoside 6'-N-acetyltransferase
VIVKVLAYAPGIVLRSLEERDVPIMARWRSDPRVIEFYSGRDRPLDEERVRRHYFGRSSELARSVEEYQPCIVEMEGHPVAFVQYSLLPPEEARKFGYPLTERSFGVDLLIGNPRLWGKGLGTRVIELTRDHLLEVRRAKRVVADPRVDNPESVRAFEKSGFRRVRRLPNHVVFEGVPRDCWLMEHP